MKLGMIKEKQVAESLGQGSGVLSFEQNLLVTPLDFRNFLMSRRGPRQGSKGRKFGAVSRNETKCLFERVQVLDSSMGEIAGMFVSLSAQGMGCWWWVLLGSCWLGENDSWSQKKTAGRY